MNSDAAGELTVAMAQSTIQNALDSSDISAAEISRVLDMTQSGVSRILNGSRRLTVRMFGEILSTCGFEVRFSLVKKDALNAGSEMTGGPPLSH